MTADVSAAWQAYQRMRVQLNGRINRELTRSTGLSEADFDILFFLEQSGESSVTSLALRCGLEWEKSRLSHQLRRMEQRGLVVKEAPGAVIRLTDRGREQIAAARACHEAAVRRYFGDVLNAEQLAALTAISDQVVARLTEDRHATRR
ncbi:MarR family transcriptional regulator [Actinoplanes sp. NBRC 14428]|uniref:DNA-binding MarR family transcriptional regulator n=1 Tax=Pseudosporangium ferrugineum TaxID=439699 RepID=A0A2T0RM94_9ACTN|nr:MarR family transcriptional regulator [Pseudosporangium ferrugineum]PRY22316.1 DNA-binding MarR family transcriptional regulator [Pseudosporangium ferrugineum]BCJ52533.1 MarR family transcriptional regulator [Actinoplanes sp. NBRC 14428]